MEQAPERIHSAAHWIVYENPATGRVAAVCDEWGINAFGDSEADLTEDIKEAIGLLFEELAERGELQQFLEAHEMAVEEDRPDRVVHIHYNLLQPFSPSRTVTKARSEINQTKPRELTVPLP